MISAFDTQLFHLINSGLSNPVFDLILPLLRDKYTWIPLYLFFIGFFIYSFGKKGGWIVLFTILTVSTSDMVSNHGFKKQFKRIRPCNTELAEPVIKRVSCGSGYSFTSNHAANHFAMATFWSFVLGFARKKWFYWFYVWAASIALAQVYVGVHYPFDVIGGGILGTLIGWAYFRVFRKWIGLPGSSGEVVSL